MAKDDEISVEPYGAAIQVSEEMEASWGETIECMRELRDAEASWMMARQRHAMHQDYAFAWGADNTTHVYGVETDPTCPLCAWDYRFLQFWHTIAYALEYCNDCGEVNWKCQQRCPAFCTSECSCRRCSPDE